MMNNFDRFFILSFFAAIFLKVEFTQLSWWLTLVLGLANAALVSLISWGAGRILTKPEKPEC